MLASAAHMLKLNGCRISLWDDDKALGMNSGNG